MFLKEHCSVIPGIIVFHSLLPQIWGKVIREGLKTRKALGTCVNWESFGARKFQHSKCGKGGLFNPSLKELSCITKVSTMCRYIGNYPDIAISCRSNPWPNECLPRMKCTPQHCRTQSWSYHGTFSVPRRGSNLGPLGWQPSTLTTRLSETS